MTRSPEGAARPAVLVDGLVKTFPRRRTVGELIRHPLRRPERVRALRGVSVEVREGELLALLGPNGAGKTTLLKVLCGLMLPEEGRAEVLGVPTGARRLPELLGLVHGDERSFYWRLTARENLDFFARLYGLGRRERGARVEQLLDRVHLLGDKDRPFSDFSSGMKQRLAIARALLADPPVVLMDEPTRSLDPVSASDLRDWIRKELHERDGKTILIATHNLREAEMLCDRVAILAKGRLRAFSTPEALRRRGLGVVYEMRIAGSAPGSPRAARIMESRALPDGRVALRAHLESEDALDPWLRELHAAGARVLHCAPDEPDLEEVFQELVRDAEGDAKAADPAGEDA